LWDFLFPLYYCYKILNKTFWDNSNKLILTKNNVIEHNETFKVNLHIFCKFVMGIVLNMVLTVVVKDYIVFRNHLNDV
jgi:hypothetical protein